MSTHNIIYSKTNEKVNIEKQILDKLNKKVNVLSICSSGCMILDYISNKVKNIDVIDINPEQLYLMELKVALLLNNTTDLLYSNDSMKIIIEYLKIRDKLSNNCRDYWNKRLDILMNGVMNIGKFNIFLDTFKKTNININNLFKNEVIYINGEKLLNNPLNRSFITLLYEITNKISQPNISYDNNLMNIRKNYHKINYITDNIISYLLSTLDNTYDIINTSDVSDNLSESILKTLINESYRCLTLNGILILRRFIGVYELKHYINKNKYIILNEYKDDSDFCKELIVVMKIN